MNKKEFVEEVSKRCMLTPYVVEEIYNASANLIIEKLIAGEFVEFAHIGKFSLKEKEKTTYKNLFGEKEKTVPKMIYPTFNMNNNIKNRVKNGHNIKRIF